MITLSSASELFLSEYKASTRKAYASVLKSLSQFVGPARPLNQITTQDLLTFMQHVRQRDLSPKTVNKYVKSLRTFFAWCAAVGFIEHTPAHGIRTRKVQTAIERDKALPDNLFSQLLDYCRWHPREEALVLFLADTGCRIGGAAGLRWSHLDLVEHTGTVTEKGDKTRPVFFGSEAARALSRWWQAQNRKPGGSYVFSLQGQRIKSDNLAQHFRRTCIRAGIGSWGPHSLRHRKGFQMADARVAPSVAATALGHESVNTTLENYFPRDYERAQAVLEELATRRKAHQAKIIDLKDRKKGS